MQITFRFAPPKQEHKAKFKHEHIASQFEQPEDDEEETAAGGTTLSGARTLRAAARRRKAQPSRPYGVRVRVTVPEQADSSHSQASSVDPSSKKKKEEEGKTGASRQSSPRALEVCVTAHAASASAVVPYPRTLRFGVCEPRCKQKALVTIENCSDVAARFDFSQVAQFSVAPQRGRASGVS